MQPEYTPYPRPQRREVDFAVIGEAWNLIFRNIGVFLTGGLMLIGVSIAAGLGSMGLQMAGIIPSAATNDPSDVNAAIVGSLVQQAFSFPINLAAACLVTIIGGGICQAALKEARGQGAEFSDLTAGFRKSPLDLAIAGLLTSLATTVGTYLCCLPGLIFGGLFMLTVPLIMDRSMPVIGALSESWRIMTGSLFMAAVVFLTLMVVSFLGVCACFVGLLVTMPLIYVAYSLLYLDMVEHPAVPAGEAPSS